MFTITYIKDGVKHVASFATTVPYYRALEIIKEKYEIVLN